MRRWRSALFVPADAHARVAKAGTRGADAVILDLEDGVARHAKDDARARLPEAIAGLVATGIEVIVRINAGWRDALADLAVAVQPGVTALMVPKAERPGRLRVLGEMMAEFEAERDLGGNALGIVALIESAAGLREAARIAAQPRVVALALGTEDLALSMGVAPSPEFLALPVRQLTLAAATTGIMALAMPISIAAIRDEAGWEKAAQSARAIGASGALCVHPTQARIANAAFTATAEEIATAQAIVAAWDKDAGVAVVDGAMVDRPVVLRARRLLAETGAAK